MLLHYVLFAYAKSDVSKVVFIYPIATHLKHGTSEVAMPEKERTGELNRAFYNQAWKRYNVNLYPIGWNLVAWMPT